MTAHILEQFFCGNIFPDPQTFRPGSPYAQALRTAASRESELLDRLDEEERSLFKEFSEAQGRLNHLTNLDHLIHGYKLGLLMTAEAFVTSDTLITGEREH